MKSALEEDYADGHLVTVLNGQNPIPCLQGQIPPLEGVGA